MGFLTSDDAPVIWRGPMLHGAIQQFFRDVAWNDLDYLIVDMPPGTGDVALSLSQTVPVAGAIVVTTPQQVSLADSRRAVRMYQKLNIPTIGIVENMSYYACTNCHHEADIFGHGGGEALAAAMEVPFLGRLPIYQPIREGSDTGVPLVVAEPASPAARAFLTVAERTAAQVSIAAHKPPKPNKGKIPLIPGSVVGCRVHRDRNRASLHQAHARQRPRRHRPRGPPRADRRGEHLVPRRVEERAPGPHRLRAPVRAPDVRGVRASQHAATSRRCSRPARCSTARPTPIAPTTGRWCRPAPSTWRCGWNRIGWATCCRR